MKKVILAIFSVSLVALGLQLYAMQTKQEQFAVVILQTSDGKDIPLSQRQFNELAAIKEIMESGEAVPKEGQQVSNIVPVPLKAAPIMLILDLINALEKIGDEFKRPDGKYIAQKIQPIFIQVLANKDSSEIIQLLKDAQYLDVSDAILNGIVHVFVQKGLADPSLTKELAADPELTPEKALKKKINIGYLNQFIEKQYPLVKDNISEKSIADHMALNTLWQGDPTSINLSGLGITSLEGLEKVPHIDFVKQLNLSNNKLISIEPDAFKGFDNLERLNLSLNPNLGKIDDHAFDRLDQLKKLILDPTTLNKLKMTVLQFRGHYFPSNSDITITITLQAPMSYPASLRNPAVDVQ